MSIGSKYGYVVHHINLTIRTQLMLYKKKCNIISCRKAGNNI